MKKTNFTQPRLVLLVEIERYCQSASCLRLNRIGLTREEAKSYNGFECERCEIWNDDRIKYSEIPAEWQPISFRAEKTNGEEQV